jgi:hypothetical protein
MDRTSIRTEAIVTPEGFSLDGHAFSEKLSLVRYQGVLGTPNRTIAAGAPAPYGHRNNQVHLFDSMGIYLTEHHASRLIESVSFIFDADDSPFPIERAFDGDLRVYGQQIYVDMKETELDSTLFSRDLPGEYWIEHKNYWIGVSAKRRRDVKGKRQNPRHVVRVSVCF